MKLLREYIRVLLEQEQGSKGSLVVVDIQPEYEGNTTFDIGDMLRGAAENYSRVLFLYNGEDTLGMISESALKNFYVEKLDYDEEVFDELMSKSEFFDKGYGFFRDVMDSSVCFDRSSIVEIVKYMIENDIRDIRELEEDDIESIGVSELLVDDLEDYGFWVPDLEEELPKWNGADLAGGARNECMAEVEILAEAQGLRFNQVDEFIYEGEVRYATKTTTTLSEGVMVNGIQVNTEIASTPATRQQGLMFRHGMGENNGMLFVFPDSSQRSFWMRNTPLPLSIAYTDDDGYILNIADMEPFAEEHTYSNGPARCALEMHRGWFEKNGIQPGHRITGIPEIDG